MQQSSHDPALTRRFKSKVNKQTSKQEVYLLSFLFTVSTTADELIPMCIPDDDMKKRRYGIPVDWLVIILIIHACCLFISMRMLLSCPCHM